MTNVLLSSGGIDSSTVAADQAARGESVELCFIDYGQPAVEAERTSVRLVADHLQLETFEVRIAGLDVPAAGEIYARNLLLVSAVATARPSAPLTFIGVHAGTGYRDCSPSFVELVQQVFDFHSDGARRMVAPFVHWSKADVVALAKSLKLPFDLTHSCEASSDPCEKCLSCLDREALLGP